jgi:preprotein translocase subunit SecF
MSRIGDFGAKLYSGDVSYDYVGRRKLWYICSAVLLAISIGSLAYNGLRLGIEFKGGAEFRLQASNATEAQVRDVVERIHDKQVTVQTIDRAGTANDEIRVQTERLDTEESAEINSALAERFDLDRGDISTQFIGPSWGQDISNKALRALVVFLLLVAVFLSMYFEWKMAVAAMLALVHDLVITAGLYSLTRFEVTPSSVIGFLTILAYSLYDTVVVFDKVRENTRGLAGGSRMTYSGAANLAVNQTLVRSINTTIVALLPIGAILATGWFLLGSGPLKDLSLALFVGVAAGAYSSIFIATPVLAALKEREPAMQALARRVAARQSGAPTTTTARKRAAAAAPAGWSGGAFENYGSQRDDEVADGDGATVPVAEPAGAGAAPRAARSQAPRTGGAQRNQPKRPSSKNRPNKKRR